MKRVYDNNNDTMSVDSPSPTSEERISKVPRKHETIQDNIEPDLETDLKEMHNRFDTEKLQEFKEKYKSTEVSENSEVDKFLEPYGVEQKVYDMYGKIVLAKDKSDLACQASDRFDDGILEKKYQDEHEIESDAIYQQCDEITEEIKNIATDAIEKSHDSMEKSNLNIDADNAIEVVRTVAEFLSDVL